MTDHHGKTVDFRNVILIMTTNAGASDMAREAVGFGAMTRKGEDEEAIKRMFTPEFRNRLDATVPFSYLPPEVVLIERRVDEEVKDGQEQARQQPKQKPAGHACPFDRWHTPLRAAESGKTVIDQQPALQQAGWISTLRD